MVILGVYLGNQSILMGSAGIGEFFNLILKNNNFPESQTISRIWESELSIHLDDPQILYLKEPGTT